ncbi:hypothetical protein FB45DRAFT_927958 [Roridomyces roridus]|uniref:Tautomerase cis-CaaD-like domain-containing protein n=1 Tax=Roridomyces roridus TaxID=1738132 RepID=A0AAD7BGV3_9AGAR|nr:hypothetical protein FB45DRAFT_927958 [Roridomyces roridus]
MPMYEVQHSYPLTEDQRADLAQRITAIHTKMFIVPAVFVNVRFIPSSGHRPLHGRQVESAWGACVGEDTVQNDPKAHFTAAIVHGSMTAAYEQGFMAPEAGKDAEWMRSMLPKFQASADAGDVFFQDMIAEMRGREDFKVAFR